MKLLKKELKLTASPLSYLFLAGALLTFVPGYPILLGAFFITLGLFYTFQSTRENNDIAYSLLLPVSKADVVKGKFAFAVLIEGCGFAVMTVITLVRMTVLCGAEPYTSNALMCANFTFLGFALLIFGLFNLIFIGGFFRTAYYFAKPFVLYLIVSLLVIGAAETLHYLPGLADLNAFGFRNLPAQGGVLAGGMIAFLLMTAAALRRSIRNFDRIDL